ncbi:MAG: hypothetical protein CMM52_15530 [Rhodospirillaceae bacterium]|nr:hypothetical protein [Rhodospirillaceae bacterium]|tara:strand:+ start:6941 stop:7138 length:198 start_codon:yes stop_codon:yes gene_type:complete
MGNEMGFCNQLVGSKVGVTAGFLQSVTSAQRAELPTDKKPAGASITNKLALETKARFAGQKARQT